MKLLYLLCAASAAAHFAFMGSRLAVILYATHLGASPAVVGILAALYGLVSSFFSVAAGRFMDRVGPVRPMLWFSAIMAAGAGVAIVWRDLAALFVVSTVIGTCYSAFFIGHTQWIGRIGAPEDRVRNFSIAALGFSLATFVAPLMVGIVIDHLGHQSAFALVAAAPLVAVAILSRWIEPPPAEGRAARASRSGSVMELVRDRRLLRIYGVSVLANATWSIVGFLVPVYATQIGLSASTIGLLMGSYSIASVVIRIFMTWLSRRFTSWQLMITSLVVSGTGFVFLPFVTGVGFLMALIFCIGLGIGLSGPLSQALLYEISPPERVGEVMGLRVTAMNITQTVVPFASGAVSAAFGMAPVFLTLALALLGGSFAVRAQWRRRRPGEKGPSQKP